jgi:hypothetical protein
LGACWGPGCWGFGEPGGDLLFHVLRRSTIGAEGFHGRVRDGIGCLAPRCGHQAGQAPWAEEKTADRGRNLQNTEATRGSISAASTKTELPKTNSDFAVFAVPLQRPSAASPEDKIPGWFFRALSSVVRALSAAGRDLCRAGFVNVGGSVWRAAAGAPRWWGRLMGACRCTPAVFRPCRVAPAKPSDRAGSSD